MRPLCELLLVGQTSYNLIRIDRQLFHPYARCIIDRVGNGRKDAGDVDTREKT